MSWCCDGASLVMGADGSILAQAHSFREHLLIAEVEVADRPGLVAPPPNGPIANPVVPGLGELEEQYQALVLATRDYVRKNGFADVGIGLSGGIDSSLVAAIATEALGADHVYGVLMPSRYSSDHSVADAEALCRNLGIDHRDHPGGARPPGVSRHAGPVVRRFGP